MPLLHVWEARLSRIAIFSKSIFIAARPYLVGSQIIKAASYKCLLQFEVCGDRCSVLELLTVTDAGYPATASLEGQMNFSPPPWEK